MPRLVVAFLALILATSPLVACTFCGGGLRTKQTLRMQFAQAKAVLQGQLKNPRFDKNDNGFTDLQITTRQGRSGPRRANGRRPAKLPIRSSATPRRITSSSAACQRETRPDVRHPGHARGDRIPQGSRQGSTTPTPAAKLDFYFKHLDSADPTVAADAFFEFARASDADIIKAAKQLRRGQDSQAHRRPEHAGRTTWCLRVLARAFPAVQRTPRSSPECSTKARSPERTAGCIRRSARGLHTALTRRRVGL